MGISDLQDDVLIHILVRLPLESLGQLKCVSKSWNALISSQKFIDSHLNHSHIVQKPNVLISEYDQIIMAEFSITGEDIVEHSCNLKPIHCLPELQHERIIIQIVGSVNGLLCLLLSPKPETIYSSDLHALHDKCCLLSDCVFALCNPLTKSTRDLRGTEWKRFFSDESLFGFWYDDVNDDYKFVIMNLAFEKEGIHVYEGEVYSLRSDSWSKVHSYLDLSIDYVISKDFGYGLGLNCAGVLLNCALHWILYDGLGPVSILVFDLRTYKLVFLPMPKAEYLGEIDHLTVLNGCLVISNGCCQYEELYDLWVMKDYGVNDSWMKITISKPFGKTELTPLALLEDNHKRILISRIGDDYMLRLDDLVSPNCWYIHTSCNFSYAKQVEFVGSLVQPYPPFFGYENVSSEEDRFENKLGSMDLVSGGESLINALKKFDEFRVYIHGVSIDSQLPEHVRRKYYDLCCSKKSFLHERLEPGIPSKLAVSMIIDVVNIADSISCRFTTSREEIEKWENSLRSFEMFGLNVGFLCERIRRILRLAFDSEGGIEAKKYWEVKTQRSQMEDEIEDLEKRLVEMKEAWKKNGDEVNTLKPKAESYELMVQEEANAPW